jgi:hypothetical protein
LKSASVAAAASASFEAGRYAQQCPYGYLLSRLLPEPDYVRPGNNRFGRHAPPACADLGKLEFNTIVQVKQLGKVIDMGIAVFDEQQLQAVTGIHDIIRNQFREFSCEEFRHSRTAPDSNPECTVYYYCSLFATQQTS